MAGWQSGHAADCKSVYAGSIPPPGLLSLLGLARLPVSGPNPAPSLSDKYDFLEK